MDQNEIKATVANDIFNKLTLPQIAEISRSYSMQRSEEYYESLDDKEKTELVKRIQDAKDSAEKASAES